MDSSRLARLAPLATAFALLCSCGGGDSDSGGPAGQAAVDYTTWTVMKDGPYACGHRELETTYTPTGGLPSRTIPVHVWYPSNTTTGEHPRYHGAFADSKALDDVPPAPPGHAGGYPIIVHSHGHKGFAGNSARLMCHLASHGWIAVAPEHIGNTISDTPDVRPLAIYLQRPLDIRASLDLILALPASDPLSGKADAGHVGMTGHSFGTYTTWAIGGATIDQDAMKARCDKGDLAPCPPAELAALGSGLSDPRPKTIIPLAGAPTGEFAAASFDAVKLPVLAMSGTLDKVGDDALFDMVTKVDFTWVEVEGGCHQLYGLGNTGLGVPACAGLPDEEGFALVNPWILAYARYHVLGDRSAEVKGLVERTTSISPKVVVKHKG